MWVSTTGEDSPQCIHYLSEGDPEPDTLQPCRSLNYALKNIRSETVIGIGCGIHVLEPVGSLSHGTPVVNLTIMGVCEHDLPHIKCTNGANLAFYNIPSIEIQLVSFQGCGEQLQHSARDSVPDSSTLYIQNCKTIRIHRVLINITGPYGTGIAVIRHDTSITHGNVLIDSVAIHHYGFHGSGLHCEILTGLGKPRDTSLAIEKVQLQNILVHNERAYPECNPTMVFTGINITVGGDGGGGEVGLLNVTIVKSTTRGSGISLALLGRVNGFHAYFSDCQIVEGWENNHKKNSTTESYTKSYEHPSNTTENNESMVYPSIKIKVRESSMENRIYIGSALVKEEKAVSGIALFIEVADQSSGNVIFLQQVQLQRINSSDINRRGLQIIVTGWARRNIIQGIGISSFWYRAYWGGGGYYIEFSEHASGNFVALSQGYIWYNHALMGGGIAVVCRDFANQNVLRLHYINIEFNFAEMGGGVYITFQDSAANNTVHLLVDLINNTAHCGGGMFIHFQGTSVGSTVELFETKIMENALLPSKNYDMMGGGIHVDFSTANATSRTDNTVNILGCWFIFNNAGQGVGGGISVIYKHSHYHGDSGDGVTMHTAFLFHDTAASGSACSFQSYPNRGKRLFRGVRMEFVYAYLTTPELMTMDSDSLLMQIYDVPTILSYIYSVAKLSMATISEQLSQAIFPSFQTKTNTNLIFAKSVQLVVAGELAINCVVSSQGLYALDSEIVFKADTASAFQFCVATHGGAIALYGESYIRVGKNTTFKFHANHAFQRGGAIYVSSAPGVVPASDCFLQYDQGEENRGALFFYGNTAKAEGQSVYVSDIRNCFSRRTPKNITTCLIYCPNEEYSFISTSVRQVNFIFNFK